MMDVYFWIFVISTIILVLLVSWMLLDSYKNNMDLRKRQRELEKLMIDIIKEMQKK